MLDIPREVLFSEPDGERCLDVASAAWLVLPGRCLTSKRQGRVRCFSRNNREFVISSSVRVTKDFDQGLVISDDDKVVATLGEVASLFKAPGNSQGFTFDGSRSVVPQRQRNREPARVIRHPPGEQSGMPEGQLQCCWRRK